MNYVKIDRLFLGVVAVLSLLWGASSFAQQTPAKLDGAVVVTAAEVKKMLDSGVLVIDTRVANEYAESHIKGAKSVTYKEKSAKAPNFNPAEDSFDLSKLPADKNASVIFYCNAGECWKSYKGSKVAIAAGYKKVFWFRGGIPEWKAQNLPVE